MSRTNSLLAALMLAATACDGGGSPRVDGGSDQPAPDVSPDTAPPDAAPDAPDAAPDATPDAAPLDAAPDAAPDVEAPDVAPPDVAPDVAPDIAPDVAPDLPVDAAPRACRADGECGAGAVCDRSRSACVECVTRDDCAGPDRVCAAGRCVAAQACASSRTCTGQVCDPARMQCVDCAADADCAAGEACVASRCFAARACRSARECNDRGQTCDVARMVCVDCLADADCDGGRVCAPGGLCRAQRCTPGAAECAGAEARRVCNADGRAYTTTPCAAGQACRDGVCAALACTPGAVECAGVGARRVCNADGQGFTTQACPAATACARGVCQMTSCAPGAASCVDARTLRTCDADGLAYTARACGARETCQGGRCDPWVCTPGALDCGGTSRRTCTPDGLGYDAAACPAPSNASPTCTGAGVCGFACNAGYALVGGSCVAPSASPLAPAAGQRVRRRPTFRWALEGGADGARLEVCSDAACASVVLSQNVGGTSFTPAAALPTGTLYWRVTGRAGATFAAPGATRALTVLAATGDRYDITGDGYADLVVTNSRGYIFTYFGGPSGLPSTPSRTLDVRAHGMNFPLKLALAGDTNGDGFADVIAYDNGNGGPILSLHGSAAGLSVGPRFGGLPGTADPVYVFGLGDVNGDGYDDAVHATTSNTSGAGGVNVFHGGPSGLATGAETVISLPARPSSYRFDALGDVNGDGYADFAVTTPSSTTSGLAVHYGSARGIPVTPDLNLTGPATQFSTYNAHGIGDMNQDGYGDFVLSSYYVTAAVDRVFVVLGGASGPRLPPASAFAGSSGDSALGHVILGGDDLDGDARPDFFVTGSTNRHWLMRGTPTGAAVSGAVLPLPPVQYSGVLPSALIGDTDGDGLRELALGDPNGPAMGYVHLYRWNAAVAAPVLYRTLQAYDSTTAGLGAVIAR